MPSIYIPPQPPDPRRLGFNPRRIIGAVNQRQRTVNLKLVQGLNAASVPVAATTYPFLAPPVYLTDLASFHVFIVATGTLSGTPSAVQVVVQLVDVNGNFAAGPGSPFNVTLIAGATTGLIAEPLLVQNVGDLVAIGLQAATPWAGGQLLLGLKGKG